MLVWCSLYPVSCPFNVGVVVGVLTQPGILPPPTHPFRLTVVRQSPMLYHSALPVFSPSVVSVYVCKCLLVWVKVNIRCLLYLMSSFIETDLTANLRTHRYTVASVSLL